jgi:hypothetical protein
VKKAPKFGHKIAQNGALLNKDFFPTEFFDKTLKFYRQRGKEETKCRAYLNR